MKTIVKAVVFVVLSSFTSVVAAQNVTSPLTLVRGGKLWLEGDSTFHSYKANATEFSAEVDFSGDGDFATLVQAGGIKTLVVKVPVQKLKSGESGLDDNMYKALKASAQPVIVFTLESYKVNKPSADGKGISLIAHGHLKLADVERSIDIPIMAIPTGTGMHFTGDVSLLMSEYQVKAPVFALVMKTNDKVTIKFDVELRPAAHEVIRAGN